MVKKIETVTLPRDLFEDLCEEAEFHAANRPPDKLGPHRALVAAQARIVAEDGGYVELTEDRRGCRHRRVVRVAKRTSRGARRPRSLVLPIECPA